MHVKKLVAALALAPALAFAQAQPVTSGQPPPQLQERSTSWQFALRSGYGVPFGKFTSAPGDDVSTSIKGDVPLALEVNYRLNDGVYMGGLFQYGFGALSDSLATACAGGSCSASSLRVGFNAFLHLSPYQPVDPWLGIGMNFEQLEFSGASDVTIWGVEFLNLQFGVDYQVSRLFAVGPYVSAALGQYSHMGAGSTSGEIANTAAHGWFNVGLKATFNP